MRSAAPIPTVEIAVGGAALSAAAMATLASVRVARRLSLPTQCELAFVVPTTGSPAVSVPIGSALRASVDGDVLPLFDGEVTAHEWVHSADGATELRVRAYDELHRLRKRQQVIGRNDVTAVELATELAGTLGLDVDSGVDGPRWPVLVQHRHSDLELLQDVLGRAGLWCSIHDGTLHVFAFDGFGDEVDLTLHDDLLEARFDATAEPACASVVVTGWDPLRADVLDGEASSPRVRRDAAVDVGPDAVGADGVRHLVDGHGPTAEHLEALAQAELDRHVAREVTLAGTALGDARLQPGRRVRVTGANPDVCGVYVLTETVHTLDAFGYVCSISTVPPPALVRDAGTSTTLGVVTDADDPDGLGRVRVELPGYGGIETDWREVLVPGAGNGRGIVAIPDEGDKVLVLLPHGDPAAGIVLGGLYGTSRPFDTGLVGGKVRRWSLQTGDGQRVVLDDERDRVVVANRNGSRIVLAPDRVALHAEADLVIECPGRTMTLRANRIELEQAASSSDAAVAEER